jgi:nucleoside-diphosphate-sugar epimerase
MSMNSSPTFQNALPGIPKKVFVTGGTGFIGSHLLKQFSGTAHEVLALRRENARPRIAIGHEPQWLEKPLDQIDAQDLNGVDVLIHLASVGVSPVQASWKDLFYWNVSVFVRLMEQAKLAGVKRLVVAGTFAEYGRSADQYEFIPPDAPLLPTYPYAASKAAAFVAAHAFAIDRGLELCYLRIFSAYGEGQFIGNFWPSLKEAAQSGADFKMTLGEQIRDYMPVEDVVKLLISASELKEIPHQILVENVGTGAPVTMRAFAEYWWNYWHAEGRLLIGALPYRAHEIMRFVPKITTGLASLLQKRVSHEA